MLERINARLGMASQDYENPIAEDYEEGMTSNSTDSRNDTSGMEKKEAPKSDSEDKERAVTDISFDDANLIYQICRYEAAWYPKAKSVWCAVFDDDDLKVCPVKCHVMSVLPLHMSCHRSWNITPSFNTGTPVDTHTQSTLSFRVL